MDRFLSSIDEAIFRLNAKVWHRNLIKMGMVIISLDKLETIPGIDIDIKGSPLFIHIKERY